MENHEERQYYINLNNIDIALFKHPKVDTQEKVIDFIKHIQVGYERDYNMFGLTRDESKRFKKKVFDYYNLHLPIGFKNTTVSKLHAVNEYGEIINIRTRRILRTHLNHKGYPVIDLSPTITVHRVVALTFIPNPENKPQVNHKDGNKLNNHVGNLEWVTNRENLDHGVKLGLFKTEANKLSALGVNNNQAKLSEKAVMLIRSSSCEYDYEFEELAHMYNVSVATIKDIRTRRSWKHI